jgi:hypothetical protein
MTILPGLPPLSSKISPRRNLWGKRLPEGKKRLYPKNSWGWEWFGLDPHLEKP